MDNCEFIYSDYSFGVLLCSRHCSEGCNGVKGNTPLCPQSLHSNWANRKYITKHYVVEVHLMMWKKKKPVIRSENDYTTLHPV